MTAAIMTTFKALHGGRPTHGLISPLVRDGIAWSDLKPPFHPYREEIGNFRVRMSAEDLADLLVKRACYEIEITENGPTTHIKASSILDIAGAPKSQRRFKVIHWGRSVSSGFANELKNALRNNNLCYRSTSR